jgi:type IV pilus assembly protein PilN
VSRKIGINLASEPFQRHRPMIVASAVAATMLTCLLGLLIYLSVMESGQAVETREEISRLQLRLGKLTGEQARLEGVLRQPANAEVLQRSVFLNSLIYAKGISWTRLFDDLEKVMPHNVRLISIRPQVNEQNQVMLDMLVGAESSEPVIDFLMRLQSSPQFGDTLIHTRVPPSQTEPLLRYRVSATYAQAL